MQAVILLCHSVSPTKVLPTLPVNTTRWNSQLLCCTLCAICQQVQQKSIGAKAAHKMMVKLAPGININNILRAGFLNESVIHSLSAI